MKKLEEWLQNNGVSQASLASELGVSRRQVNRWVNDDQRPLFEQMVRIARITNLEILPNDWIRPGELGDIEAADGSVIVVAKTDPVHLKGRQHQAFDDLPLPRPM